MEKRYFCWALSQYCGDSGSEVKVASFEISEDQFQEILETDPVKSGAWSSGGYYFNSHESGMLGYYRNTVVTTSILEVEKYLKENPNTKVLGIADGAPDPDYANMDWAHLPDSKVFYSKMSLGELESLQELREKVE